MKYLIILLLLVAVATCEPFAVKFQWNTIDVVWPTEEEREYAMSHGEYIAANNALSGIKFWKGKMYLTVPRWKDGVPVTLGVTSAVPINGNASPKLEAFPTWDMQKVGDCSAFQQVQSMEIDPKGRMWVIDSGHTSSVNRDITAKCPPRLVILDLETNGTILRSYEFPPHVARPGLASLNDIVLDHEDGGFAYITDSEREQPGLIVYSLLNNTSWKIRHDSMNAKSEAVSFMVAKTMVNQPVHIDGIALSPANSTDRLVYYSPLSSFQLYTVPTSALKSNTTNIDSVVKEQGRKNSQTNGMAMSSTGVLYFGLLADDAISTWDTKHSQSFTTGQRVITRDHERLQWPDTFAFDEDGYFWCLTNSLQNFHSNRVNVSAPNYRVISSNAGAKSYQYYEDGSVPPLPVITAGAARVNFMLSTVLAVLLVFLAK